MGSLIYNINKQGTISLGPGGPYMCTVKVSSSLSNNISLSNDINSINVRFKGTKTVSVPSTPNGDIKVIARYPTIIRIIDIKPYKIKLDSIVYAHGNRGDILLATGYIQSLIDILNLNKKKKLVVAHGGTTTTKINEIFDDEAQKVFDLREVGGRFIADKNEIKAMFGNRNLIFFGPPGSRNIDFPHINKYSIVPNEWKMPFWFQKYLIDKDKSIGLYRYTWNQETRSISPELNDFINIELEKYSDEYKTKIIGYKDPLPMSDYCINYNNRLSMFGSIGIINSLDLMITIDSWPAAIAPRMGVETILLVPNEYSYEVTGKHFHTHKNIHILKMSRARDELPNLINKLLVKDKNNGR